LFFLGPRFRSAYTFCRIGFIGKVICPLWFAFQPWTFSSARKSAAARAAAPVSDRLEPYPKLHTLYNVLELVDLIDMLELLGSFG
jgi:hypothetical protein